MKLVTYDLDNASDTRRIYLDRSLQQAGFKRILQTVWVGDVLLSVAEVQRTMASHIRDKDKVLILELDSSLPIYRAGIGDETPFDLAMRRYVSGVDLVRNLLKA